MTLRPEYSLGHSEYNPFLFAAVGEEKGGLTLTVLTALSRLGLDPWQEAARLSNLPKEAAARAFAVTIGRLPEGDWKASDCEAIAVRLVNWLPGRSAPPIPLHSPAVGGLAPIQRSSADRFWLIAAAIFVAALLLMLYSQPNRNLDASPNEATTTQQ